MIKNILLVFMFLFLLKCKQIQVPSIYQESPLGIKLGEKKIVKQPDFDFRRVYKRSVSRIQNDSMVSFSPCSENMPQIQFDVISQVPFQGIPQRPVVVYDFDDIRYSKFLLDLHYSKQMIHVIFKNSGLTTIFLINDTIVKSTSRTQIQGIKKNQLLELGYFVQTGNNLLFVNGQYVINIINDKGTLVKGYDGAIDFESVIGLGQGYFGVVGGDVMGVYYFDGSKLQKISDFTKDQLGITSQLLLTDIAYQPINKLLILSDLRSGIRSLTLSLNPQNASLTDLTYITDIPNCKVIHLKNMKLYGSCNSLLQFDLQNYPVIKQTKISDVPIDIKQIDTVDDLIILMDKDTFMLIHLGNVVNFYQDKDLDQFIVVGDILINGNDAGLEIRKYTILQPYITCFTDNPDDMGMKNAVFTTIAECNKTFFKQFGIKMDEMVISDNDTCVYTVHKPISYWKMGEIKIYPYIVAVLTLFTLGLIFLIVFLVKNTRISSYQRQIDEYSGLNVQSESAKNNAISEDMFGSVQAIKQDVGQELQDGTKKKNDEQMFQNVHEFG